MSWEAVISGYGQRDVDALHRYWVGKVAGTKEERLAAVLRALGDEAAVAASVKLWPAELRRAMGFAVPLGGLEVEQVMLGVAAAGVEDAEQHVRTLVERGVLLPDEVGPTPAKVWSERVPVEVSPLFLPMTEVAVIPPLPLPTVPPGEVRTARRGDPDAVTSAVHELLALADRGKLAATKAGVPTRPTLTALGKATAAFPGVDGAMLLVAALCAGLLTLGEDGRTFRSTPDVREIRPWTAPTLLRVALTLTPGWMDDHPAADEAEMAEILRLTYVRRATPLDAADARFLLAHLVERLPADEWVAADAVVDAALRAVPDIGVRHTGDIDPFFRAPRPADGYDRDEQRTLLLAILARTLPALGLLDVGTTAAGEIPRPAWKPLPFGLRMVGRTGGRTPSPLVVRRVERKERAPAATGAVHVGPDFEVVAPSHGLPSEVRVALDRLAAAVPGGAHDPVRRWRLERERWVAGVQAGVDGDALLAALAKVSGRPVPANVVETVAGWVASVGRLTAWLGHDLVEWPSAKARNAAVKELAGARPVGETFALVPAGSVKGERVDAARDPARVLVCEEAGGIRATGRLDLVGRTLVERIAVPTGNGGWTLDRDKLAGVDGDAIGVDLVERLALPMPPGFQARLLGWSGALGAAGVAEVEVVRFASDEAGRLATALPEVRECLAGDLGGGTFLVKPGKKEALKGALGGLGVRVGTKLRLDGVR